MKEVTLGFQVEFDHYLDFDENEGMILQYFVGEVQAEDPVEFKLTMNELVDDVILEGKQDPELGYQYLYNLAHEFSRYSELAREAASILEGDINAVGDLFGLERGDLG